MDISLEEQCPNLTKNLLTEIWKNKEAFLNPETSPTLLTLETILYTLLHNLSNQKKDIIFSTLKVLIKKQNESPEAFETLLARIQHTPHWKELFESSPCILLWVSKSQPEDILNYIEENDSQNKKQKECLHILDALFLLQNTFSCNQCQLLYNHLNNQSLQNTYVYINTHHFQNLLSGIHNCHCSQGIFIGEVESSFSTKRIHVSIRSIKKHVHQLPLAKKYKTPMYRENISFDMVKQEELFEKTV